MSDNEMPGVESPSEAPDFNKSGGFFGSKGRGEGVRRLNKLPILIAGVIVFLVLVVVLYAISQRGVKKGDVVVEQVFLEEGAESLPIEEMTARAQYGDLAEFNEADARFADGSLLQPVELSDRAQANAIGNAIDAENQNRQPARQTYQQAQPAGISAAEQARLDVQAAKFDLAKRIAEDRLSQQDAAFKAESSIDMGQNRGGAQGAQGAAQPSRDDRLAAYLQSSGGAQQAGGSAAAQAGVETAADRNNQPGKKQFLADLNKPSDDYLTNTRTPAVAPRFEVKAGSIIPGVLISGINSDLPGQIIAQVRQDVYDSVSGTNLLIPAGSRLIGAYDSGITRGQTRALAGWQRIIYPDGSSLSLLGMPGADLTGAAGFKDKVDNHYFKIFGTGLLISVFSAGAQLSQPQPEGDESISSQAILAAELGRQMTQLGIEVTRSNLEIQPTLRIRPGFKFNVMVTSDMILTPWRGHPLGNR